MPRPETCSICGEEVRWGWRPGLTSPQGPGSGFWMHREDVDHTPILGRIMTPEDIAEQERQLDLPRERHIYCDPPFPLIYRIETYTVRELELAKHRKDKRFQAMEAAKAVLHPDEDDDDEEEGHELEPIEIHSTPMPTQGALQVGGREIPVPGGVRIFINLLDKIEGWEVERLTYARGPYLSAKGKSLGVSDSVVLRLRGPLVDGRHLWAVASWRDGKSQFAYAIHKTTDRVGARALATWMKEAPRG